MLFLIARGFTLGLTAGIMPGPLQTYLIQTTLTQGWRKSIIMVISPLIADTPMILITLFVLAQFPPEFIRIIQIVGGLFVLWLARAAWLNFRSGAAFGAGADIGVVSARQLLTRTVMINLLSPGPYIFWGTVNGPLLLEGLSQSVFHGVAFLIAFYGTFLSVLAGYVLVFDRLRSIDPRVTRALLLIITILLVVFGLSLIGQGLGLI
jgi:threonine/homoserine/homoserine lactone efflux protein